jgi:putative nucleotidyltransferase with HDIG domain
MSVDTTPVGSRFGSGALGLFVRGIVAIGAALVVYSLGATVGTPEPLVWLFFAALALLTGWFKQTFVSGAASISVEDTFLITSAMLLGPGPAAVMVALNTSFASWRRKDPPQRIAFNSFAPAISLWAGSQVFFAIARTAPLAVGHTPIAQVILPLLALTIVYFLLNSGLTSIAIALETGQSPVELWRRHFLWLSIGYFGASSVAFCLVLLIEQVSYLALIIILPLLAILHLTLRSSFGRLDDAHRYLKDMDRLYLSTVETLAMAIDAKDDVTHSHVRRVQAYAVGLATALGLTDELTLKAIEAAALLHDTGKLAIPEHILNKPGSLTVAEFDKMKEHVDVGADILSLVQFPYPVVPIVRGHHENWDGSGYPRGVAGEEIPIGARILSVVDCFDALTSDRPYRLRMTDEQALDILRERRGRMYDPKVVDAFIATYRTIAVTKDPPAHREVMQRIASSRHETPVPNEPIAVTAVPGNLLTFVSLARVASGGGSAADVLALSSMLIADLAPDVTGAWYLPDASDRLVASETFGPSAAALVGVSVDIGERLTGWVAANRQPILNADAALDLGVRGAVSPPLNRCLSVPLLSGDALVGVLSLYASEEGAFNEELGRRVQLIAPHLAIAIQGAQTIAAGTDASSAKKVNLRLIKSG